MGVERGLEKHGLEGNLASAAACCSIGLSVPSNGEIAIAIAG